MTIDETSTGDIVHKLLTTAGSRIFKIGLYNIAWESQLTVLIEKTCDPIINNYHIDNYSATALPCDRPKYCTIPVISPNVTISILNSTCYGVSFNFD